MTDEFTVDLHVRYRDLDPFDHVNNAVYASYFEEARAAYAREVFDRDVESFDFVIGHLEISFDRPITYGDDPTVAVETTALGETSATLTYDLRVDGETAATGETTLVFVDPETKRPRSVPDDLRDRIASFEGLEG